MKQFIVACLACLFFTCPVLGQVKTSKKFSPRGNTVIVYKQGNACTASPYAFYLITDAGEQVSTPFYTLADTTKEVNGIGINPVDQYMYGVQYNRDAQCVFYNFHLKRYDGAGNEEDLGTLPAPVGGTVLSAMGCVTRDGKFIYSTKDAQGTTYATLIDNIAALPANAAATLTISSSKALVNNAGTYTYSDWASHPTNGKIYSYGISTTGGVSTGSVLQIDPLTGSITTVGTPDATSFTDPASDNFGGLYFGTDFMLYGVNTATRKLYRIDAASGAVQYRNTISGTGTISADMGSFISGQVTLPINFEKMALVQKADGDFLAWRVIINHTVKEFVIEQSLTGHSYTAINRMAITTDEKNVIDFTYRLPAVSAVYRIKAVGVNNDVNYSAMIKYTAPNTRQLTLLGNPVTDGRLRFVPATTGNYVYNLLDATGRVVGTGKLACTLNAVSTVELPVLNKGIYYLQLAGDKTTRFIIE